MATSKLTQWLGAGALRALASVGGANWMAWVLAIVVLTVLNTMIDQVSEWTRAQLTGVAVVLPLAVLAGLLVGLYWLARRVRLDEPRAEVEDARPVKALILFLSPPGDLTLYGPIEGSLDRPDLGTKLGRLQWRMPIAAVAHHIGRLERLIVVCSCGEKGTLGNFADFKKLVERLLPPGKSLRIETSGELLAAAAYAGSDFEDPKTLIGELGQIYRRLRSDGVKERDILIDVTGGTKVNTAAAVALTSQQPDRRFQYVSTNTYKVKSFDVTWDIDSLAGAQ